MNWKLSFLPDVGLVKNRGKKAKGIDKVEIRIRNFIKRKKAVVDGFSFIHTDLLKSIVHDTHFAHQSCLDRFVGCGISEDEIQRFAAWGLPFAFGSESFADSFRQGFAVSKFKVARRVICHRHCLGFTCLINATRQRILYEIQ